MNQETILKPTLIVQTVVFNPEDRPAAAALALELYGLLTRDTKEPPGFGTGIPVFSAVDANRVDPSSAGQLILLVVLGAQANATDRDGVVSRINQWRAQISSGEIIVTSPTAAWSRQDFPANIKFAAKSGSALTDRVILAVAHSLGLSTSKPQFYISHTEGADEWADAIANYARTDPTARDFFAKVVDSIEDDCTVDEHSVLLVLRTDDYASNPRCTSELHLAKQKRIPILTVEGLENGVLRSDPYAGNGPSLVAPNNEAVVRRAIVECLRHRFFQLEALRIADEASLPEPIVIGRPPELFDLAQTDFNRTGTCFVMHPDPELPAKELELLLALRPRLYLTTPTTAYRHLRNGGTGPAAPLDGMQVAVSLSESPDVYGPDGFTESHVDDAIAYLSRTIISAGAALAYGGDLRKGGYTYLLTGMMEIYNRTAATSQSRLRRYQPADSTPDSTQDVELYHVGSHQRLSKLVRLPKPTIAEPNHASLHLSDMRRLIALDSSAMIVIGGKTTPDSGNKKGYSGRFPGIVEESWWMLEADKPIYVIGGFGGAAGLVAGLLQDQPANDALKTSTWQSNANYQQLCAALAASGLEDKLQRPATLEALAEAIREKGRQHLATDETSRAWNGLTRQENFDLHLSRDPIRITALILKGLLETREHRAKQKLHVELVRGDITQAPKTSAICIAVYKDAPVAGAGAVLDGLLANAVTNARHSPSGVDLIETTHSSLDADWLVVATLGELGAPEGPVEQVRHAARAIANQARRYGFNHLSTVQFGGSAWSNLTGLCDAMIEEFRALPAGSRISLFEIDPLRFKQLRDHLIMKDGVDLTTHVPQSERERPRGGSVGTFLAVSLSEDELTTRVLPPPASGVGLDHRSLLDKSELQALSAGAAGGRSAPDQTEIDRRRKILAAKLLGDNWETWLSNLADTPVVVRHDLSTSQIPFEILIRSRGGAVGITKGLTRVLALPKVDPKFMTARPPKKGRLRLLLVIDPRGDLKGARAEGNEVRDKIGNSLELVTLVGPQATKEQVRKELASADIFHYCGHAFYDGVGNKSGLNLADGTLTAQDLADVGEVPRLAFVNACEGGRVRNDDGAVDDIASQAFAELFLRMGVEAYLGTYWRVGDTAAAQFSATVYSMLAQGQTLGDAVTLGRSQLADSGATDWVNYVLYGNGEFKLTL